AVRVFAGQATTTTPKDGINDHVVTGAATVAADGVGTKAAMWYQRTVAPGETTEIRLRFASVASPIDATWTAALAQREQEADEYYGALSAGATADEAAVMRQAFAGMMWGKQFFHYDVARWLDGDPATPPPPDARKSGRNHLWRHLNNHDIISMPDPWEYPWYAAWDLAFHCVALAHIDPTFAKEQLLLLAREWYMHPNGQIPAYEWSFDDVNPPVQAWAAMRVFDIDGRRDFDFLGRMMHKLLINFTWWVNRKDTEGNNVFEGGFLGLDNIGPIDRSAPLPVDGTLEQADGTAWMAMYCLDLLEMSITLARHDIAYEDLATKFLEHFAYIATAINESGLWDEKDGFYYDVLNRGDGDRVPLRVRSMVGLLPLAATITLGRETLDSLPYFAGHFRWFCENKPEFAANIAQVHELGLHEGRMLSIVSPDRLRRLLGYLLDESEFLSPHGIRALSAFHRDHPFQLTLGSNSYQVDYEPAESRSAMFGGNSNWRGPVWFPVNYIVVQSLRRFGRYFGPDFTAECPVGSGVQLTLDEIADELEQRLCRLFLRDPATGRRPCFGGTDFLQNNDVVRDRLLFNEYFNGDDGAGLGASHQTGWTGLVADLIARKSGRPDVLRAEP
ncbi:MAG: glucosidase, partial [Ilumatobacteraceae bacterium]